MRSSIFAVRARIRLRKTMHNVRVTLLCSLLTFIVLRSSLGAGKFGTPAQDYDEIRHHLKSLKLRHNQNRLLMKDASRSALSVSEDYLVQKSTPDLANAGEAKQRASWLADYPNSTNGRTSILLVTGSHSTTACQNAVGAQLLLKSMKNKMDYCRIHGIEIFFDSETFRDGPAEKASVLRTRMLSHPEVEWIWWMESYSMVTDMLVTVPVERYRDYNHVMYFSVRNVGNADEMVENGSLGTWPSGSFLLKNCHKSMELLSQWAMADKVKFHHSAEEEKWPFVADFSHCNICGSKDVDRACMSDMEMAVMFADGQQRQLATRHQKSRILA